MNTIRAPRDRVHIVLADCDPTVGPAQRPVWELATRLSPLRYRVRVWLSTSPVKDDLASALEAREIQVERIPTAHSPWDLRGRFNLWLRGRHARPDVLHLHRCSAAAGCLSARLAASAGESRMVVTEHAGSRSAPTENGRDKDPALGRAEVVTVPCSAVGDSLVRAFGVLRDRLRIVRPGADPPDDRDGGSPRAERDRLGAGPFRPLWVTVGRLEPGKGHAVLLEALANLERKGLPFVLAVVGVGSLKSALEREAAELRVPALFLEPPDELGPLLSAADAVIFPSLWETIPSMLLDVMARGRPVVASAVGGIPEVVEDGWSGRLVPPGDARALAEALETLHRRPDWGIRLGSNAARMVREDFAWGSIVDGYEAVYDEVLGFASFGPEGARPIESRA